MRPIYYFLIFIKTINRQIVTVTKQDNEDFVLSIHKVDLFQIDMNSYERLKDRMVDYELDMPREKIMIDLQLDEFLI
jgi:hypothetical protein